MVGTTPSGAMATVGAEAPDRPARGARGIRGSVAVHVPFTCGQDHGYLGPVPFAHRTHEQPHTEGRSDGSGRRGWTGDDATDHAAGRSTGRPGESPTRDAHHAERAARVRGD